MDLDEEEPRADDSLANTTTNQTVDLVDDMVKETGARKRKARSPTPEGSASSCEEAAPVRRSPRRKSKNKSKNNDNIALAAINALQKLAGLSKSKRSAQRAESDEDSDDEIEKPFLVNWANYNVKDNGQNILDMKLRNALKTINSKPEKYFKYFDREIKPSFETVEIDHMNFNSVNPRITKKMHDRAAFLELKYFDPGNISVNARPPKASFSARSGDILGELSLDWTEPQTMWACFDAVLNYSINCYSIRSYDYSPWVLIKALHEMRFFNICKSIKEQKKVFTNFVNAFFRKNELEAKKKNAPLDLEAALKVARAELSNAGYGFGANTSNIDPYAGGKSEEREQELKQLRSKVRIVYFPKYKNLQYFIQVAQLERENADLKRRVAVVPRSGYNGKPIGEVAPWVPRKQTHAENGTLRVGALGLRSRATAWLEPRD